MTKRHLNKEESVFKDAMGRWRTQSLFIETSYSKDYLTEGYTPLFSLKDYDHQGKPSLKRLYLETADPTEYRFAVSHLGGWAHWLTLCELKWFQPYVDEWRMELEVKLRSDALIRVIEDSHSDSRSSTQSAKYLADGGYKEKAKRGRPTKQDQAREKAIKDRLSKDAERIGLSIIKQAEGK